MTAYMINLVRDVTDREALERYWSAVGKTYSSTGKALVAYTPFEMLEGSDVPVWGVVLIEFESAERRPPAGFVPPAQPATPAP